MEPPASNLGAPSVLPATPVPAPVGIPPSEESPPPPIIQSQEMAGVASESKKGVSWALIVFAIIVLLGILGFVVYKFVLPMLGGQGGVATPKKEVTLTWWGLWEDQTVVNSLISEYQQKNPNVKINYLKQSKEDYRERLTNALAKGSGPDIFRFHNTWVPMFKSELDLVPQSVMTAAEYSKNYYPVVVSDMSLGTGFVGIPLGIDTIGLFVNEEIFETQGKSAPKTWDELRETAISLTVKDEKGSIQQSGVALGRTENVDHWPEILSLMMLQNGVKMSNPVGKPAEDALTYYSIFSSVDGVWDETLPPSTVAFAGGKLAMYFGPSWRVFEIKAQNPNLRFRVVPVPQLAKDSPDQPDVNFASYWVEGVWKRSKNRETAWGFLKFVSSKESLQKLYSSAASQRPFGELYPRVDMASLVSADPLASAFVSQAPTAKSFYLSSRTFDGPTGINSQIIKYFEDAVNSINAGAKADKALETVAAGVNQVLSNYGLTAPAAQTQKE